MKNLIVTGLLTTIFGQALVQSAPAHAQPAQPAPAQVAQATPASSTTVVVAAPAAAPAATATAQLQLSADDIELISDGEIGAGAHILGVGGALFLGFGAGQAVQGRWGDKGWIFTVGETASLGVMVYGVVNSASSCAAAAEGESCGGTGMGLLVGGALAYSGFRVWEIVDAVVAPMGHNRRVRAAKLRAGGRPAYSVIPYVTPPQKGDGAVAGISLQF